MFLHSKGLLKIQIMRIPNINSITSVNITLPYEHYFAHFGVLLGLLINDTQFKGQLKYTSYTTHVDKSFLID